MRYEFNNHTLVRDENDDLYVLDENKKIVWELSSLTKTRDSISLLHIIDDQFVEFTTFNGMKYKFDVINLKIVEQKITK